MADSEGARFYKADLHTHTPASKDHSGKDATPEKLIQEAAKKGIDILGITDHNSVEWIESMRSASEKSTVTVLPGVEITTPEGHILALFEVNHDTSKIADLLISVGIQRDTQGKEEAISDDHAEIVIKKIHEAGGLAIAAHANENNGLLKAKGQYKIALVPLPQLAALEHTKESDIDKFCNGKLAPTYPAKPCTHSSDSHSLAEIGRRVTYLKMDKPSLRGVRHALLDHEVRVRFPWNYREPTHPRIMRLSVDQGFFGGLSFGFHESLNCLVGGKGTGKSTVIELLRYCFDDVSEFRDIREDHEGKIASLVGHGGSVVVEYLDGDGEVKTIKREVQPWATDREVRDGTGSVAQLETSPAFFSQGEFVQIASNPLAQLDLIDRRVTLEEEQTEENRILNELRTNAKEFVKCQDRISHLQSELDNPETGKEATRTQYKSLERQLKNPVLKEFPNWEAEQEYVASLDEALGELGSAMENALDDVDLTHVEIAAPADAPNKKIIKGLEGVHDAVVKAIASAKRDLLGSVEGLRKNIKKISDELTPLFNAKKDEHDSALEELGQKDVRKVNARFRSLGKRVETLRKHGAELTKVREEERTLDSQRGRLLDRLDLVRKRRWEKRNKKAEEFEVGLGGLVRIKVVLSGDRSEFEETIRTLSRSGYVREPDIRQAARVLSPRQLLALVRKGDINSLAKQAGVTQSVSQRLVESFSGKPLDELYELECVSLPDLPEVTYVVEPGREKTLRELSTGQKGTVIISLAMIEGRGPLVIDQPEEPLDTQSIYGHVVKTLRRSKEDRQFIFTTHNPNIAVGADAELSHVLDASADKGEIKSSGAVDHLETNKLLLVHLEGGKDALRLRIQKYDL